MSNSAEAIVKSLLGAAAKLCGTGKVAHRNQQSLEGNGFYGRKFHSELLVFAALEDPFRSLLSAANLDNADKNDIEVSMDQITSLAVAQKTREISLRNLELICHRKIIPSIVSKNLPPSPVGEAVLPKAVVIPTKENYLINVVIQANACYEARCYDATSVMIRKLAEATIILAFERNGKATLIKNASDDFLMLSDLVTKTLSESSWNLARETRATLPKLKTLGDRAAHNRRYLATKADVDGVLHGLRVVIDDLLHIAKLK